MNLSLHYGSSEKMLVTFAVWQVESKFDLKVFLLQSVSKSEDLQLYTVVFVEHIGYLEPRHATH